MIPWAVQSWVTAFQISVDSLTSVYWPITRFLGLTQHNVVLNEYISPAILMPMSCIHKYSFLGILELSPSSVFYENLEALCYICKYAFLLFVVNLVCFIHQHYCRLLKMLSLETYCNFQKNDICIEKNALSWLAILLLILQYVWDML